jgi:hypothetical protein
MSAVRWAHAGVITLLVAPCALAAPARGRWVSLPEVTDSPLRLGEDVSDAVRSGSLDVALPFALTIDGRPFGRVHVGAGFIELIPQTLPSATLAGGVAAPADRGSSLRLDVVSGSEVSLPLSGMTVMASSSEAVIVRYAGLVVAGSPVVAEIALRPPGDVILQYLHVPLGAQQAAAQGRVHAGDALTSIMPASATAFRLRQPGGQPGVKLPAPAPLPQAPPPFPSNCNPQPGTWCDVTSGGAVIWLNETFDDGLGLARGWTATDQWHEVDFATCAPGASSNPGKSFYYGNNATCSYLPAGAPPRRNGSLISPTFGPVTANGQFSFTSRAQYELNPSPPPDFDLAQIYVNGTLLGGMPDTLDPTLWYNFAAIPLAPWAGLSVQIEFYFEADDTVSFLGWFVDDVIAWDAGVGSVDCILNAGHQTWTGCDVRNSDVWHFNESAFCAGCQYSFYVLVECGRQMHLPLDDMEGAEVRVTNMVTGLPPTLRCLNQTAVADAGNGPYPGFTIPSAVQGINLDCGAPPGDDVFWGPAFDATDSAGPGAVSWGFNRNCPDIYTYDRNASGTLECNELPGPGGLLPNISPGEIQTMDCYIEDSVGLCGLYRVDVTSGGFDWFLFANCDGTHTPQFPIYHDCTEAWTAFNPLPELALANLTASNTCPATLDVTFDLLNIGCTDQLTDVVVELTSNCVPPDSTFVVVPGPIPANSSVPVQAQFTVNCEPVRIEATVDPGNLITECTESPTAASCNAEPGVDFLATFTCGCTAQLNPNAGPDQAACANALVSLDGSRSTGVGCPTQLLYRWLDAAGGEVVPQSPSPTAQVPLTGCPAPTTFTLEIQCAGEVCTATDTVTISCLDPTGAAGSDVRACAGDQVRLDGSGSSVAGCAQAEYRWLDPAGLEVRGWSQNPVFLIPALDCADAGDYTVEVRCTTGGTCFGSDVVNVACVSVMADGGPDFPVCEDAPIQAVGTAVVQGCADVFYGWFVDDPGGPIPITNPAFSADPNLDLPLGVTGCPGTLPLLFVAFCDANGDGVPENGECLTIDPVVLDCTRPTDPVPVATVDCSGGALSCGSPEAGVTYSWDLDVLTDADADTVPDNDADRSTCDVAATPFPPGDTMARVTATDGNGCTASADVIVTTPVPWTPVEVTGERLTHQGAIVGFTGPAAPGRAFYRLLRGDLDRTPNSLWVRRVHDHAADDPVGRGACIVNGESHVDPDDGLTGVNYYYLVIAVGPCGEEGPTGDQWDTRMFFPRPGRTPTVSCP